MRTPSGKYEAEIRLALALIVGLLLVLNTSTAYMLHNVKQDLTEELDRHITAGLDLVKQQLSKSGAANRDNPWDDSIRHQAGLTRIHTISVTNGADGLAAESIRTVFTEHDEFPEIDVSSIDQLMTGKILYRFGRGSGTRLGIMLVQREGCASTVIIAEADAQIIGEIGHAAQVALFMATGIMAMIIILMVLLPRYILRPFKILQDRARSAGKLQDTDSSDDVADVVESYERIIEELKKNENELEHLYRESSTRADRLERLNEYILKSIGSGVINIDLTGKVIGFNRAASEILGYDSEEVIGKHYLVGFPGETELELIIGAGLERGDIVRTRELEFARRGRERKWLGVESSIIFDDRDNVMGLTLVIADLTDLKKLQAEVETNRQLAALGEMTGGLAHQLRNSLAAISGFCQLLQKKAGPDNSLVDIADSIRSEAASSESMVNRFLNFARPLSLMAEELELTRLLEECREKWLPEAGTHGVDLSIKKSHDPISIVGDPLLLKEALGNVIDNAIQAAGAGGSVRLSAVAVDSQAEIAICDSGPGIPESMRERLFTPFVSSKPSGTGLGLALARKIVNLHNGSIAFDSSPDGGTVCRVIIPIKCNECIPESAFIGDSGKNL